MWTAVCLLVTPLHGSLLITAAAHPTKAKSGKKRQKSRFIYIPQQIIIRLTPIPFF
jgi:hypothetical protein